MHSMSSFYNYLCKYVYKYTHNFWKKRLGNGVGNGEGERNDPLDAFSVSPSPAD